MRFYRNVVMVLCVTNIFCSIKHQTNTDVRLSNRLSYRMLLVETSRPDDIPQFIGFRVGLDYRAEKDDFARLICNILKKEDPKGYSRISVSFYYNLTEYVPSIGNERLTREQQERSLASYIWDAKIPESTKSLAVFKDQSGNKFPEGPRFFPFDHLKDCAK